MTQSEIDRAIDTAVTAYMKLTCATVETEGQRSETQQSDIETAWHFVGQALDFALEMRGQ